MFLFLIPLITNVMALFNNSELQLNDLIVIISWIFWQGTVVLFLPLLIFKNIKMNSSYNLLIPIILFIITLLNELVRAYISRSISISLIISLSIFIPFIFYGIHLNAESNILENKAIFISKKLQKANNQFLENKISSDKYQKKKKVLLSKI